MLYNEQNHYQEQVVILAIPQSCERYKVEKSTNHLLKTNQELNERFSVGTVTWPES